MDIIVLDGYTENPGDLSWEGLEKLGRLTVYDRTPQELIVPRIGDAEAVYINKTPITRATLDACPGLRFIGVLATGYNVVDIEAAKERGVVVCNVPAYGTGEVAQFAIALLLELCHHVGAHSDGVKRGDWTRCPDFCYWDYPLVDLEGKTMGVIGFGRIGQRTARIAQAMGMEVLAYSPHPKPELEGPHCRYADLDALLAGSDVIVLHCPLFPETEGLINRETIAKMKDGVMIVNNSRGGLVVEADLRDALNSGKVAGAASDVASTEPIQACNPLLEAKNMLITPHISWASRGSRARLLEIAVNNLAAFQAGKPVNQVNK